MEIYAALREYDDNTMIRLCENAEVEGVILGDLFCPKKMFQYPDYDLYRYMEQLADSQKRLVYQTPMYMTDSVMLKQYEVLDFIKKIQIDASILVQDVGMLRQIKRRYPDFGVIWGQMGRNRQNVRNIRFYELLFRMGVDYIETYDNGLYDLLTKKGMNVCIADGGIEYQSLGRNCYSVFQYLREGDDCFRICREDGNYMKLKNGDYRISVNGYILGETHRYVRSSEMKDRQFDRIIIYKSSMGAFEERVAEWML